MNRFSFRRTPARLAALLAAVVWGGCATAVTPPSGTGGAGGKGETCGPGTTLCGAVCADTANDPANCGACGTACAEDEVCSASACGLQCAGGSTKCEDACVDVANNPAHCGACDAACAAGEVCSKSKCALTCAGGSTKCGDLCVDTENDPANCGACDAPCDADQVCTAGVCGFVCLGGTEQCGQKCTNTKNDPLNCGMCGTVCSGGVNGAGVCADGKCSFSCVAPFKNCNQVDADGCEINGSNDEDNCGACDNVCPSVANGQPGCVSSMCGIASCNANFGNCDGDPMNGCETNVLNTPAHCGLCNNPCAAGLFCSNGMCIATPLLTGSYKLNQGPLAATNPQTYSCKEACAVVFGGQAGQYFCSTSALTVTQTAWVDGFGDTSHCPGGGTPAGEGYKLNSNFNCGMAGCSFSAFVNANCGQATNYCFK